MTVTNMLRGLARADEPGFAVAVLRQGQEVERVCVGLADLAHGVPIRPETRFHIVSMSKTFMAASILLLSERGRLSGNDDVTKHLPEYPTHGQPIAILSDRLVHVGDEFDGVRVLAIREAEVDVEVQGQRTTLRF